MIFADFFADNAGSVEGVPRETVIIWASALGILFYAALVTMTIEARSGAISVVDGLKAGAIVASWYGVPQTLFFTETSISRILTQP